MQFKLNKIDIGMFLVFVQNIAYFMYLYTRSYSFLILFFIIIFPLIFFVDYKRKYISHYCFLLVIFVGFLVFGIFSQEYEFYVTWYNLLYLIAALLAAYFFINSQKGLFYSYLSFYLYSFFLTYFIIKLGANGEAYNEILEGSSRNYLSAISIFLTINIYVQLRFRFLKIVYIPAVLNFILCLLLFGRSGIALSFVILLFVSYIRNYKVFIILIFSALALTLTYLTVIIDLLNQRSNFAIGLESERSIFRKEYLTNIFSNNDFLFGRKISECCAFIQSFGNPHNSFIMGHLRYGIFHTFFSVLILFFVILKRDFILLFFVLIIFSRYFLDQLGLFAFFDFVLFSILFLLLIKKDSKEIV